MKIKFIFIGLMISSYMMSQTEKGKFLITGNVGFNYTNNKSKLESSPQTATQNSVLFNPSFSYFVKKNFHVGLLSSYSKEVSEFGDNNPFNTSSSTILIGPQVGYIFNAKGMARFFLGASYGFSRLTVTNQLNTFFNSFDPSFGASQTDIYNGDFVLLSAGVALFFNENISFNLGLQANYIGLRLDGMPTNLDTNSAGIFCGFALYL